MAKKQLTPDSEFIVKEDTALIMFFGVVIYLVVAFMLFASTKGGDDKTAALIKLLIVVLGPFALIKLAGALEKSAALTVNKYGIYHNEDFLTTWDNFLNAYITERPPAGALWDVLVLIIEYQKDGIEGYFKRHVRLTNTQNKSEEEIIEAITFFKNYSANSY